MSTIQFTNLTDKELAKEADWQLRSYENGMTLPLQVEVAKRFTQYAQHERVAFKKIDNKQLDLFL